MPALGKKTLEILALSQQQLQGIELPAVDINERGIDYDSAVAQLNEINIDCEFKRAHGVNIQNELINDRAARMLSLSRDHQANNAIADMSLDFMQSCFYLISDENCSKEAREKLLQAMYNIALTHPEVFCAEENLALLDKLSEYMMTKGLQSPFLSAVVVAAFQENRNMDARAQQAETQKSAQNTDSRQEELNNYVSGLHRWDYHTIVAGMNPALPTNFTQMPFKEVQQTVADNQPTNDNAVFGKVSDIMPEKTPVQRTPNVAPQAAPANLSDREIREQQVAQRTQSMPTDAEKYKFNLHHETMKLMYKNHFNPPIRYNFQGSVANGDFIDRNDIRNSEYVKYEKMAEQNLEQYAKDSVIKKEADASRISDLEKNGTEAEKNAIAALRSSIKNDPTMLWADFSNPGNTMCSPRSEEEHILKTLEKAQNNNLYHYDAFIGDALKANEAAAKKETAREDQTETAVENKEAEPQPESSEPEQINSGDSVTQEQFSGDVKEQLKGIIGNLKEANKDANNTKPGQTQPTQAPEEPSHEGGQRR